MDRDLRRARAFTSGGASGGYVHHAAPNDCCFSYYVAPGPFHGDWRDFGGLVFSLRSAGAAFQSFSPQGDVFLANGSMTAKYIFPFRPATTWEHFSIPLADGYWVLGGGAGTLDDVLVSVTDFRIRAEFGVGLDTSALDEVALIRVPTFGVAPWGRQLGTSADDKATGVVVDPDGNTYVTGFTFGALDGNASLGGWDSFLIKYDSAGNKLWSRQFGTPTNDYAGGVAIDADGDIYVAVRTGGAFDGNLSAGGADYFLVKFDSGGNKLWSRQHGTLNNEGDLDVTTDTSGNVYVIGSTFGGLDGNPYAGLRDAFLAAYDTNGNRLWTQQLGTAQDEWPQDVATDEDGNIFVTGFTHGGLSTSHGYL